MNVDESTLPFTVALFSEYISKEKFDRYLRFIGGLCTKCSIKLQTIRQQLFNLTGPEDIPTLLYYKSIKSGLDPIIDLVDQIIYHMVLIEPLISSYFLEDSPQLKDYENFYLEPSLELCVSSEEIKHIILQIQTHLTQLKLFQTADITIDYDEIINTIGKKALYITNYFRMWLRIIC